MTALFNAQPEEEEEAAYDRVALSITASPRLSTKDGNHVYFGSYFWKRWSDNLDHDAMVDRGFKHEQPIWQSDLPRLPALSGPCEALHVLTKSEYEGQCGS